MLADSISKQVRQCAAHAGAGAGVEEMFSYSSPLLAEAARSGAPSSEGRQVKVPTLSSQNPRGRGRRTRGICFHDFRTGLSLCVPTHRKLRWVGQPDRAAAITDFVGKRRPDDLLRDRIDWASCCFPGSTPFSTPVALRALAPYSSPPRGSPLLDAR